MIEPAAGEYAVEAIAMTASGCGTTVKEYGHLLAHDPAYAAKAKRVSAMTRDLSELVADEPTLPAALALAASRAASRRIAYHPPCSLQHGQQVRGRAEQVLKDAGFTLTAVAESHLCCGSAGAYSVLNPEISTQLKERKLANLEAGKPDLICSANIGCLTHLQSGTATPVKHWVEVVDQVLA
jgi:glycolate oxidase iron-sulfur subunit